MLQRNGKRRFRNRALPLLLLSPFLLGAASCPGKKDPPPAIPVCIGDGVGGADCVDPGDKVVYRTSQELRNWWITSPDGIAAFTDWCYGGKMPAAIIEQVLKTEVEKIGASQDAVPKESATPVSQ